MINIAYITSKLTKISTNTFNHYPEECNYAIEIDFGQKDISIDTIHLRENNSTTEMLFPDGNLIVFDYKLPVVFNAIERNRDYIFRLHQHFDILSSQGADIGDYIRKVAAISNSAALFANPSGRIITSCNIESAPFFKRNITRNTISRELLNAVFRDANSAKGYFKNTGIHPDIYGGRYIDEDGEVLGIVLVCALNKSNDYDLSTARNMLLKVIKKRLGPDMSDIVLSPRMNALKVCWEKIMNREIVGSIEIIGAFQAKGLRLGSYVRLGIVRFRNPQVNIPYNFINTKFHAFFPDCMLTIYRNDILILINDDAEGNATKFSLEAHDKINAFLTQINANMMLGNITKNIASIRSSFLMTRRTFNVAMQLDNIDRAPLIYYEDYCTYNILDMALRHYEEYEDTDDPLCMIHPAIIQLTDYDNENNTNLRDILYYYLTNDRNILQTSGQLNMTRTTLQKKIRKAKEIMNIDIDSSSTLRQRIIFSCQFINYYEHVKEK